MWRSTVLYDSQYSIYGSSSSLYLHAVHSQKVMQFAFTVPDVKVLLSAQLLWHSCFDSNEEQMKTRELLKSTQTLKS